MPSSSCWDRRPLSLVVCLLLLAAEAFALTRHLSNRPGTTGGADKTANMKSRNTHANRFRRVHFSRRFCLMWHLKERRTLTSRVDLEIAETIWPSQMLTNTPSEHLRTRRQKASVCRRGGYPFDYLGCSRPPLFRAQSLALEIS